MVSPLDPGRMPTVAARPPVPPPVPMNRRTIAIAVIAIAILVALAIGIGIGRATRGDATAASAPPAAPVSDHGRLRVFSKPVDGNVTLDGRFVGVAPLEGLDLDPGKHSIVVDAFAYQPYAGTLEIEPRGKAKITVVFGPTNGSGATTGEASGCKVTTAPIPLSALAPPSSKPPPKAASGGGGGYQAPREPDYTPPPPPPPPERPRRNCSGENSTCRDGCSNAYGSCRFACPNCVGCSSSIGEAECTRTCEACRSSCEQNKNFCESSCNAQNTNCNSSNY